MTPNQYTFRYRVRNWSDYNRALIARGRLTFWFDEDAVAAWRNADPPKGPGAPKVYSDTAIQCALILKSVFQLSLRSTQGFVSSLLELLRLDLPVPDYSTLSRRQSSLATFLTVSPSSRPRHVVVDATGLRVYGSGEWHVRKHRHGRRRAWRKLHLGVDERTKEIVAVEVHRAGSTTVVCCRPCWIRFRVASFKSRATGPMTRGPVINRYSSGRLLPPSLRDAVHG